MYKDVSLSLLTHGYLHTHTKSVSSSLFLPSLSDSLMQNPGWKT